MTEAGTRDPRNGIVLGVVDGHEGVAATTLEGQLADGGVKVVRESTGGFQRATPCDSLNDLYDLAVEVDPTDRYEIEVAGDAGRAIYIVQSFEVEAPDLVTIRLNDGSGVALRRVVAHPTAQPPRDIGVALLEPVTTDEYRAVEEILTQLERWVSSGQVDPIHENRILTIADFIRETQHGLVVDETPRWQVIGPVKTGVRILAREVPIAGAAWTTMIHTAQKVRWDNFARWLGELVT